MGSALNSGSSGLSSSPGLGNGLFSWARHFTLIVPLFTHVYEWALANLLLGVQPCGGLAFHPGGGRNIPQLHDGPFGLYSDFTCLQEDLPLKSIKYHPKSAKISVKNVFQALSQGFGTVQEIRRFGLCLGDCQTLFRESWHKQMQCLHKHLSLIQLQCLLFAFS